MLTRLMLTAELVGQTGRSTASIAHILGAADANNRRDHICSAMLLHDGRMVQAVEGKRADVDRMLRRMQGDPRLKDLRVIADTPIAGRLLTEAAGFCHQPAETLAKVGLANLELLTVRDVEAMLDYRQAA
ncbi:hypothetical protein BH09PSE1_BH09PSE1_08440 [soil metagenome]